MGKNLVKGSLIGGLIVYFWMMISWMILPWHCATLNSFQNEDLVRETIYNNTDRDGIFIAPNFCSSTEKQASSRGGPFVFTSIQHGGLNTSAASYIITFIVQIIAAAIITYLVMQTPFSYTGRVFFITLIGLFAALVGEIHTWTWWGFSFSYVMSNFFDLLIGWFLAGLAIAKIVKPKSLQE